MHHNVALFDKCISKHDAFRRWLCCCSQPLWGEHCWARFWKLTPVLSSDWHNRNRDVSSRWPGAAEAGLMAWNGEGTKRKGVQGLEHEQRWEHLIKHIQRVASKCLGTKHEERQCPVETWVFQRSFGLGTGGAEPLAKEAQHTPVQLHSSIQHLNLPLNKNNFVVLIRTGNQPLMLD